MWAVKKTRSLGVEFAHRDASGLKLKGRKMLKICHIVNYWPNCRQLPEISDCLKTCIPVHKINGSFDRHMMHVIIWDLSSPPPLDKVR